MRTIPMKALRTLQGWVRTWQAIDLAGMRNSAFDPLTLASNPTAGKIAPLVDFFQGDQVVCF